MVVISYYLFTLILPPSLPAHPLPTPAYPPHCALLAHSGHWLAAKGPLVKGPSGLGGQIGEGKRGEGGGEQGAKEGGMAWGGEARRVRGGEREG